MASTLREVKQYVNELPPGELDDLMHYISFIQSKYLYTDIQPTCRALSLAFRRLRLGTIPESVFARQRGARSKIGQFEQFVAAHCTGVEYLHAVRLRLVLILLRDMLDRGVMVSPSSAINYLPHVADVFNRAYPGYLYDPAAMRFFNEHAIRCESGCITGL